MIVKFHARGAGRGSGPVDYLLGKGRTRDGATLDRGDPDEIQALIDSSPYAKKYTSGVLSFEEPDLPRETKDKIMSSFEKALLPGLDVDQYSCLWVEHRDKGRLELNFVVPNIELLSGKRLQPYFDKADKPRINAWKVGMNTSLKLHDPDDPANKRELVTSRNLPLSKQKAATLITDGLLSRASKGEIQNRKDVVNALQSSGFTVVRETNKSVSISDPDGGRNIRLKGMIYEQDFKFSEGLRAEIEAASERYRAESESRILEARALYHRGVERKRTDNQKRYPRPESDNEITRSQKLAVDGVEYFSRSARLHGGDLVARQDNRPEPRRNQPSEIRAREVERSNVGRFSISVGKGALHRDSRGVHSEIWLDYERRKERAHQTGGEVGYDRVRATTIERIRQFTSSTREAAQGFCSRLQEFGANVRDHLEGKRNAAPASESLERAGRQLEQASDRVEQAIQKERSINQSRELGGIGRSL
ncbi:plasmid mobilization relaxase MbeA [Vibrio sp. McD22-P3]|uniref:plasmid mobilization relaxase MbeA n=1 Tax=Vibrio sp. McD22-P3 TaxID=2724880 RepID=UPI001F486C4F|nr:relaxase/mobilization nuclease domain-containing protein [Vibrio sp. McD22-P3]MCF4176895.1 relaxase/mobilization nuclease domain-containing protein [Vibrio sp. McD22-P3]